MREANPNTRVLILEHKDNTNPLAIDKTGTIKLIQDSEGTELYYNSINLLSLINNSIFGIIMQYIFLLIYYKRIDRTYILSNWNYL